MEADLKFLIPLSVSVVVLNSLAIWLVRKTKRQRKKSTSMILISLLISDMLIGAVVIPTRIIDVLFHQSAIFPYIYAYLLFVAAFNVLFLTWDRYTSVGRPLRWKLMQNGRVAKLLVVIWLVPVFISLVPLAWMHNAKHNSVAHAVYRYFLVAILLVIIFIVVVFQILLLYELYGFWYGNRKSARLSETTKKQRRSGSIQKRVTSAALIIGVTLSTISTWLPTIVLNFRPLLMLTWVAKMSLYSFFVNSLVDPLLVIIFNINIHLANLHHRRAKKKRNTLPLQKVQRQRNSVKNLIKD